MELLLVSNIVLLWLAVASIIYFQVRIFRIITGSQDAGKHDSLSMSHPLIGKQAPEIEFITENGTVYAKSWRDNVENFIIIFDPLCDACVEGLKKYKKFGNYISQRGGNFVVISIGEANETVAVINEQVPGLDFAILSRGKSNFNHLFQITRIPTYFRIDGNGTVESVGHPDMYIDSVMKS